MNRERRSEKGGEESAIQAEAPPMPTKELTKIEPDGRGTFITLGAAYPDLKGTRQANFIERIAPGHFNFNRSEADFL